MYLQSSTSRFGHFVEWLLALGLYRLVRGAMFVLLLAGAGCLHSHNAALARVPLVAAGHSDVARLLLQARRPAAPGCGRLGGLAAPPGGRVPPAGVRAAAQSDVGVLQLRRRLRGRVRR